MAHAPARNLHFIDFQGGIAAKHDSLSRLGVEAVGIRRLNSDDYFSAGEK